MWKAPTATIERILKRLGPAIFYSLVCGFNRRIVLYVYTRRPRCVLRTSAVRSTSAKTTTGVGVLQRISSDSRPGPVVVLALVIRRGDGRFSNERTHLKRHPSQSLIIRTTPTVNIKRFGSVKILFYRNWRQVGSEKLDTKAQALTARYFSKSMEDTPLEETVLPRGALVRDSHVVLRRDDTDGELHYRVLSVSKKYYNKWYMCQPSDVPPVFNVANMPKVRLSLQMLKKETTGNEVGYSAIRNFDEYKWEEVYTTIDAADIYRVEGSFGTD